MDRIYYGDFKNKFNNPKSVRVIELLINESDEDIENRLLQLIDKNKDLYDDYEIGLSYDEVNFFPRYCIIFHIKK